MGKRRKDQKKRQAQAAASRVEVEHVPSTYSDGKKYRDEEFARILSDISHLETSRASLLCASSFSVNTDGVADNTTFTSKNKPIYTQEDMEKVLSELARMTRMQEESAAQMTRMQEESAAQMTRMQEESAAQHAQLMKEIELLKAKKDMYDDIARDYTCNDMIVYTFQAFNAIADRVCERFQLKKRRLADLMKMHRCRRFLQAMQFPYKDLSEFKYLDPARNDVSHPLLIPNDIHIDSMIAAADMKKIQEKEDWKKVFKSLENMNRELNHPLNDLSDDQSQKKERQRMAIEIAAAAVVSGELPHHSSSRETVSRNQTSWNGRPRQKSAKRKGKSGEKAQGNEEKCVRDG